MEQINTTTPAQMDIDWSGEVRYPDVPSPSATAPAQTVEETQVTVTTPAAPAAPAAPTAPVVQATPTAPVVQAVQGASPYYHLDYDELRREDFPAAPARAPLDLENPVSQEVMANPTSNSEVYQASMKSLLARNIGYYVVATFQIGSQGTVSVPGFLYTVGNDYIVLYQPDKGRFVTGDLYALKFVDFHQTQSLPQNYPG